MTKGKTLLLQKHKTYMFLLFLSITEKMLFICAQVYSLPNLKALVENGKKMFSMSMFLHYCNKML